MHFTTIKNNVLRIRRYWQNKAFREKTLSEKRKLYLLNTKQSEKRSFFSILLTKKRFNYFNTVLGVIEKNRERFRLSFVLTGLFLILASGYILFFSPYFRISPSRVVIERVDTITDINIAYRAIEDFYGASIFSINTSEIQARLMDLQKNIKHVEVSRLFPNGLKIIIESYKPQFNIHLPNIDKNYVITSNGILIYQKDGTKLATLDLIDTVLAEAGFLDYKQGVRENFMGDILTVREKFGQTFPSVNIAKFSYFQTERELHIALESGTKILVRLGADTEKQIAMLKFYNDNNKDIINSGNIDYIDTRIIGKIFVCQEKNICEKNLKRIYGEYYGK